MDELLKEIGRKTYAVSVGGGSVEQVEASRIVVTQVGALALFCSEGLVALYAPGVWLDVKPAEDVEAEDAAEENASGPQPREVLYPLTEPSRPPEEIRAAVHEAMRERTEG